MILKYLTIPYVAGGRDYSGCDCYGLILLVRRDIFGKPDIPSYSDIDPLDKKSLTKACIDTVNRYLDESSKEVPGAIAAAWHGKVCVHVGVVVNLDSRWWIMETDKGKGVCLTPISAFESQYSMVKYYD